MKSLVIYKQVSTELERNQAFEVRKLIFVEEQHIPEEVEWDGLDNTAVQFVAKKDKKVIGTVRVRFPSAGCAKIERMAVLNTFRRQGIGRKLLTATEEYLRGKQVNRVILHAQWAAIPFYQSCGFVQIGAPFFEAAIKHIKMEKKLDS